MHGNFITLDGRMDILGIRPLARRGYMDYTSVADIFEMKPEGLGGERLSKGLEGLPCNRW